MIGTWEQTSLLSQTFRFCMRVGGWVVGHYSDFKLVKSMRNDSRLLRPCPSIAALEGVGPKCHIVAVYNLKFLAKIWKSMWTVTINCEFSLFGLICHTVTIITISKINGSIKKVQKINSVFQYNVSTP